mgnify:CR=1 FL=1
MNEARPFASLSSGLLARKGAAKPAMRPQGFTGFEDLGWNDMGHEPGQELPPEPAPEHVPSSIAAVTPAPKHRPAAADESEDGVDGDEPHVVAQQRAILESFDGEEEPEPAEAAPEPAPVPAKIVSLPKRAAAPAGRKAAFTLRLDADRHLRLRLACAVTGRSAQQIVTGALDQLLATIPEIDALAQRVPSKAGAGGAKRN